jgi:hypothetical protein
MAVSGRKRLRQCALRGTEHSPWGCELALNAPTPRGSFDFALTGPPAVYVIFSSTDLAAWNQLGTLTNTLCAAVFTDVQATNSSRKFYRAHLVQP